MNMEIMRMKGKLAEDKNRFKELEMDVSETLKSIRMKADPYEEDVTKLKTQEILHFAKKLDETIKEMQKLKEKIEEMQKDLG